MKNFYGLLFAFSEILMPRHLFKIILTIIIVTLLIIPGTNHAFGNETTSAIDQNQEIYQHLHDTGIMKSHDSGFMPELLVTRSEALVIAMRAGGIFIPAEFDPTTLPNDIDPNEWFAPAVARAIKLGFVGRHSERFRPYDAVGKAEFLAFLFRAGNARWQYENLGVGFLAHDINKEDWFAPLFRYAQKYGIANISKEKYYFPYQSLTRHEVAVITYRQLKLFHGDELTKQFMELQAQIDQFITLINDGQRDKAMIHLQRINHIAYRISISKNDQNAVAAKHLARSMKSLIKSLQAMEIGNNLRALEQIYLADDYSQKAAEKSPKIQEVTVEIDRIIENTLTSLAFKN